MAKVQARGTYESKQVLKFVEPGYYVFKVLALDSHGSTDACEIQSYLSWTPSGNVTKDSPAHFFGLMASFDRFMNRLNDDLDLAQMAGVRTVRFPFRWPTIEPEKGKYSWSTYDKIFAAVGAHNMTPQPMVFQTPAWARRISLAMVPGRYRPEFNLPRNPGDLAKTLGVAAQRYSRYKPYWEIWNEPHAPQYWIGGTAEDYVKLLRATYPAIKAADPTAQVLNGGLGVLIGATSQFASTLFERGGNYFDIFAIHSHGGVENLETTLDSVRDKKQTYLTNKPIWVNESGISVDPNDAEAELTRAAEITKKLVVARHYGVENFALFILRNGPESYSSAADNFAVVDSNGEPRPVLLAYNNAVKLLIDSNPFNIELQKNSDHAYAFKSGNRVVIAAWGDESGESASIRIPLSGFRGNAQIYDMFGAMRNIEVGKELSIRVSKYPVYVVTELQSTQPGR